MVPDLLNVVVRSFSKLFSARDLIVFCDSVSEHVIHWNFSLSRALERGVFSIVNISHFSFDSLISTPDSALFLISEPNQRARVEDIISKHPSQFRKHCVLCTPPYHEDLSLISTRFPHVQTVTLPALGYVALLPTMFLLPGSAGLGTIEPSEVGLQWMAARLAAALDDIGCREEIFTLGANARTVGARLRAWNRTATQPSNAPTASVVLIDRDLDLATPAAQGDALLTRVCQLRSLQGGAAYALNADAFPFHVLDSRVPACEGCLGPPTTESARHLYESLLLGSVVDGQLLLRHALTQATSTQQPFGPCTTEHLAHLLHELVSDPNKLLRAAPLAGMTAACLQAMHECDPSALRVASAEQRLKQLTAQRAPFPALLSVLLTLLRNHQDDMNFTFEQDFLPLMVHVLAHPSEQPPAFPRNRHWKPSSLLSGSPSATTGRKHIEGENEHSISLEYQLADSLAAFLAARQAPDPSGWAVWLARLLARQPNAEASTQPQGDNALRDALDHFIFSLQVAARRGHEKAAEFRTRPLLRTLAERIFDPSKPAIPGLEHQAARSGLGSFLGFGRFRASRVHPGQHSVVLFVVIGGVSPAELQSLRSAASTACAQKRSAVEQVLVGATHLLAPNDVVREVLSEL